MNRTKKFTQSIMLVALVICTLSVSARELPTLTDFQVVAENDQVSLRWSVEENSQSQTFVVERSSDAVQFEEVQTIRSEHSHDYHVKENSTSFNPVFYRLKITDASGQTHYSKVVTVLPPR